MGNTIRQMEDQTNNLINIFSEKIFLSFELGRKPKD